MGKIEKPAGAGAISESDHLRIDSLEEWMLLNGQPVAQPLTHTFLPGLYVRTIHNPAGSLITTKIHLTDHPFVLLRGRLRIWVPDQRGSAETLIAPHFGITRAGTRRVILAIEDSTFITFHANPDNCTDLDELERRYVSSRTLSDGRTGYARYTESLSRRISAAADEIEGVAR
jgi:hypothetical protein